MLKLQTARKKHVCTICGEEIPVGSKYWREYELGGDDGALMDRKEHTSCPEQRITANGDDA
jgi:hypothetical protein